MEYLKPMEHLNQMLKLYKIGLAVLAMLLGIAIVLVPFTVARGNCTLVQQEGLVELAANAPWKIASFRIETFAKKYLSARFDFSTENAGTRKDALKNLVSEKVLQSLKSPLEADESLAKTQSAQSYYLLEERGLSYSNTKRIIEAKITRVVRVRNAAVATPMVVRLSFQEAPINTANPYGLIVDGLEELDPEAAQLGKDQEAK